MLLKLGRLSTVIRPKLTVTALGSSEQQTDTDPWMWYYSSASFGANHLFHCLLARLFIDAIIFGDKRACTIPDMLLQLEAAEDQSAQRLLQESTKTNTHFHNYSSEHGSASLFPCRQRWAAVCWFSRRISIFAFYDILSISFWNEYSKVNWRIKTMKYSFNSGSAQRVFSSSFFWKPFLVSLRRRLERVTQWQSDAY